MPETTDVSCKGSRFNNVTTSNVIYIGQTNDEKPVKCPKTCAQRGSWANPATSTTEGLALALQYFGNNPHTLVYSGGTFDEEKEIGENITGPSTKQSSVKLTPQTSLASPAGANATKLAGQYSYDAATKVAKAVAAPSNVVDNVSINGVSMPNGLGINAAGDTVPISITISNTVLGSVTTSAALAVAAGGPSIETSAAAANSGGSITLSVQDSTITSPVVGGLAVSHSATGNGTIKTKFSNVNTNVRNGTLSSISASGPSSIEFSSTNGEWADKLAGVSSSSVSAFITRLSDSAAVSLMTLGNSTDIDVGKDTIGNDIEASGSSTLTQSHANGHFVNRGKGTYYRSKYLDDAVANHKISESTFILNGPKVDCTHDSSRLHSVKSNGNTSTYTGKDLLVQPFQFGQFVNKGGLDLASANDATKVSSAVGVAAQEIVNKATASVSIDENGNNLINLGDGDGYAHDNQMDGAISFTRNGGSTTVAGTAHKLKNTDVGTLTYRSSAHRYNQTVPASPSTRAVKALGVVTTTVGKVVSASSLVQGVGATKLTSNGDFVSSEQDDNVGFSLENASAGSLLANISNPVADLGTGTVIQHRGSGTGTTMVNAISTIIQSAETFMDSQSTDDASASFAAATTATPRFGSLKAFSKAVSNSTRPTTVTATGASFDGTTTGQALFSAKGHVATDISNFKANLTGDDDQFFSGSDLLGGVASTFSSSRLTRPSTASTKALVEASGDGTPSVTASDIAIVAGSGSHLKVDGLKNAEVKLSVFSKPGLADESPLVDVNNIGNKLSILSSTLSSDKGHGIATLSNVIAEIQASSTSIAEGYANYKNDGGSLAEFAAAQSNGILNSATVNGAIITTIANKFT